MERSRWFIILNGVIIMATIKAFLVYLGNRTWKKAKSSKVPRKRKYLKYLGDRKWKKVRAIREQERLDVS